MRKNNKTNYLNFINLFFLVINKPDIDFNLIQFNCHFYYLFIIFNLKESINWIKNFKTYKFILDIKKNEQINDLININ
jgi:hypothetical protein